MHLKVNDCHSPRKHENSAVSNDVCSALAGKNRSGRRTRPKSQHVRDSMSTAFMEDDGDPVLSSTEHLSETSTPSDRRLAACVPGSAVPRQMQDVPAYGGMGRTLHRNCEQRIGPSLQLPHHRRFHPSRDQQAASRHTFARSTRSIVVCEVSTHQVALQYSSRRNARRRSSCLYLASFDAHA